MLNDKVDTLAGKREEAMAQHTQNDTEEEKQRICRFLGLLICKHCKIYIVFEDTQDDFNYMRRRVRELFTQLEDEHQNWTHYEEKDKNKCVTIKSM
jgi:hypothetical protein